MEESNSTSGRSKWYGRLAWIFAGLFSIFWSLGSFFFWVLLGLATLFGFFSFHYSDVKISIFETQGKPEYESDRTNSGSPGQNQFNPLLPKIIRAIVIGAFLLIIFIGVVGVFSSNDDNSDTQGQTTETTSSETSASGDSDDVTSYTNKGIELFNKSEYDSALFYYNKVLEINPNDADGIYNKALVFYMKQDYRKSINIVKKCLRQNPDYNSGWWLLGDDYYSMNQYDSAIVSLEKAYKNDYSDPGFLELLGDAYLKNDNPSKAKDLYLQLIQQDTTKADVYKHLAELDPSNAEAYRARAAALENVAK